MEEVHSLSTAPLQSPFLFLSLFIFVSVFKMNKGLNGLKHQRPVSCFSNNELQVVKEKYRPTEELKKNDQITDNLCSNSTIKCVMFI